MSKPSVLEVLKAADIPAMRVELQLLEGKLELASREFRKDIDALKMAIKLAEVAQHGKPERKQTQRKPRSVSVERESPAPTSTGSRVADQIAAYLTAAGPSKVVSIQRHLGLSTPSAIYSALNAEPARFKKHGNGEYSV